MIKTQVYLSPIDLKKLHSISKRMEISVVALIRQAISSVWIRDGQKSVCPVGIWDGPVQRTSSEHDSI